MGASADIASKKLLIALVALLRGIPLYMPHIRVGHAERGHVEVRAGKGQDRAE